MARSWSSTRTTRCASRASSRTSRPDLDDLLLLLRVALSLAAVLGLLWLLQRRVGRKQQQRRDGAEITVKARRSLGSKAQLVIVETDDVRYVLGVTEHGVNLIERMPAEHVTRPVVHPASTTAALTTDDQGRAPSFDEVLAAEGAADSPQTPPVPSLRRHRQQPRRADPLQGSILSPQTWRQTVDFMRRGR